jgi:hypothetical protein
LHTPTNSVYSAVTLLKALNTLYKKEATAGGLFPHSKLDETNVLAIGRQ